MQPGDTSILKANPPFIVKQWSTANAIIAGVFYFLTLILLVNIINHKAVGLVLTGLPIIFLVMAIVYTMRALQNKPYIEINETGIYGNNTLLTRWEDFISADFYEKENQRGTSSTFIVRVFHRKPGIGDFEGDIPMESTLDKSPEEVIEAIKHFYQVWRQNK